MTDTFRDPKWPSVEGAMRRVQAWINGGQPRADGVAVNGADLSIIMHTIEQLTSEAKQHAQPRVGIYQRLETVETENAALVAALLDIRWRVVDAGQEVLAKIDAALAKAKPQGSGE